MKISGQCWLHPILNRTPSEGSPSPLNLPSSTLKELRNLGETVHRYGPSPCTATLAYYRDIKQFPLLFPLWLAQKKHLGFLRRSVPWLVSRRWEKGQVALSHQQLNSNLPRASFVFSSFAFVALTWFGEWSSMVIYLFIYFNLQCFLQLLSVRVVNPIKVNISVVADVCCDILIFILHLPVDWQWTWRHGNWALMDKKQKSHNYRFPGISVMFVMQGIFRILKIALHFFAAYRLQRFIYLGYQTFLLLCCQKVTDVFELSGVFEMGNIFKVSWIRLHEPSLCLVLSLLPLPWQNSCLKQLLVNSLCSCQN